MRLHADVFRAQMSLRPNVLAPKCPRAQIFAPKCRGPLVSGSLRTVLCVVCHYTVTAVNPSEFILIWH